LNIKEFFGIDDPAYYEYEIYEFYKHTTRWKLAVLKVRLYEGWMSTPKFIRQFWAFGYFITFRRKLKYPVELIELVNKWENHD